MAVIAPYWPLPTTKLSCKNINFCSVCIDGYHKKLCLGNTRGNYNYLRGLQIRSRKRDSRAAKGGGFEGSGDGNDDNKNDGEEYESFWDRKETQDKIKELEDMKDLIEEAEKLHEKEVAAQAQSEASMEESQEEKMKRLREELAKRAKEQAKKRKTAELMFEMGQRAYGKGMYNKAVELLEGALSNVPKISLLGGEIQLWLAMAYEAHNRHGDCIALYRSLESSHPIKGIRDKAAGLRFILEAPKLKITPEEMVTIPLIESNYNSNYDSSKRSWSQMYRNRRRAAVNKRTPPKRDYFQDFLDWKRPQWERSPVFWVAVAGWLTLVGVALVFQD